MLYKSGFNRFLDGFLMENPTIQKERLCTYQMQWNGQPLDREELRYFEQSNVPRKAYMYETDHLSLNFKQDTPHGSEKN